MAALNKQVLLASRPQGAVTEDNFRFVELPVGKPGPGEVLVKNEWLSLDPYMRGRMSDAKSYAKSTEIGELMVGQTVGEVIESRDANFNAGDKVLAPLGWQLYGIASATELTRIDVTCVPASYYLGILGMPGMTAWFGLLEVGQPKPGNTVVVSAASGAVGSVVGQLASIKGCRVVGIAGGKTKCDYVVNELGFDACVDYKQADFYKLLKAATPKGIDIYFENVGGEILEAVLKRLNVGARIPLCGLISGYNGQPIPINNPFALLTSRAHLQGFIISDHLNLWPEAIKELGGYVVAGKIKYRETI